MPKVKNTETATETVTKPTVAATPKVAKTPKVEKPAAAAAAAPATPVAKKSAAKEKAPAVVAPAPVASTTTETAVVATTAEAVSAPTEFTDFMTKLQQLSNLVNTLKGEFRTLEKKANKELKSVAKANAKRKRNKVNRAPSGFVKPTLISAELATFLGKTAGTEMARTEVTREINAYIRENQLQDKSNGRVINADVKLSSLLKIPAGEELTYFNLQKYMSPHFTKAVVA